MAGAQFAHHAAISAGVWPSATATPWRSSRRPVNPW